MCLALAAQIGDALGLSGMRTKDIAQGRRGQAPFQGMQTGGLDEGIGQGVGQGDILRRAMVPPGVLGRAAGQGQDEARQHDDGGIDDAP
ncbi:MAG TPA: hypothetical protein PLW81_15465 [Thiobacillaceae bacterium]|nr:hypothetical protein [Thiobacillaceae bacterium]